MHARNHWAAAACLPVEWGSESLKQKLSTKSKIDTESSDFSNIGYHETEYPENMSSSDYHLAELKTTRIFGHHGLFAVFQIQKTHTEALRRKKKCQHRKILKQALRCYFESSDGCFHPGYDNETQTIGGNS